MLFDTMPVSRQIGPIPVWPYFFLSVVAAVLGTVCLVFWLPGGYPTQSELKKVSGEIKFVTIRNDISKTHVGAFVPGLASTYFTLKGVDGEFRYPSTHPKYPSVSGYTGGEIDVWIDDSEVGTGEPITIWQIQERNPLKPEIYEQTSVTYAEVIDRLTRINRSVVVAGYWLFAACGGFMLLGFGVRRWNRGRPHRLAC